LQERAAEKTRASTTK